MKKAASKTASPSNLGSKRQCPKCATKFYDFGKEEIVCPKCKTEIDPQAQATPILKPQPEAKRAKVVVDDEDAAPAGGAAAGSEEFESVDDLGGDDDEDVVEGVAGDDEDEESF